MVDCSDIVKLLYRAAKLINSDITDCRGISIRPPSVVDLSLTNAKALIPDIIYWLQRWIIAKPEKEDDDDFSSQICSYSSDERLILTLAQDVVHRASHARVNMPKHIALGIAVRHTKRSKQLFLWFSVRIPHGGYHHHAQ